MCRLGGVAQAMATALSNLQVVTPAACDVSDMASGSRPMAFVAFGETVSLCGCIP
ncbi:MAG: hypothetical protein ACI83N_000755 [Hydrogenophaga sp.]|jgi:hypothetical protein